MDNANQEVSPTEDEILREANSAFSDGRVVTEDQLAMFQNQIRVLLDACVFYPELMKRACWYFLVIAYKPRFWKRLEEDLEWRIKQSPNASAEELTKAMRERWHLDDHLHYLLYVLVVRVKHQVRTGGKRQTNFCGWKKHPLAFDHKGVQMPRLAWECFIEWLQHPRFLKDYEPSRWCEVHEEERIDKAIIKVPGAE